MPELFATYGTETLLVSICIYLSHKSILTDKSSAANVSASTPGCRWVDWLPDMKDPSACGRPQLKTRNKF